MRKKEFVIDSNQKKPILYLKRTAWDYQPI